MSPWLEGLGDHPLCNLDIKLNKLSILIMLMNPKPHIHVKKPLFGNISTRVRALLFKSRRIYTKVQSVYGQA